MKINLNKETIGDCLIGVTLCLMILTFKAKAQPVIGMGAGYSLKTSAIFNWQLGAKINNSHVYYNQIVHLTRKDGVAQILGLRYGYNIGDWQPSIGYDYQIGGEIRNRWCLGYGLTKYFKDLPLILSAGRSGKYTTFSIGAYKIIE